ncbi:MAG: PA0069 family radical SAM protein [Bdellovibrionaceae bacterium]|nr:PA0069 family radical SAM protein [Pseudobdellovibrionaceae bacterium]
MKDPRQNIRGRGASSNPDNRFQKESREFDPEGLSLDEEDVPVLLRTEFLTDASRSIVTENKSPDIGFRFSVNPYRGCEHGCAYCYARPTHEYLGYSAGLDFESKIFVKEKAPELLKEKLLSKNWKPEAIFLSGITDCYQPIERKLQLTRRCLEVLAEFKNPFGIITKNHLVTRDVDLLAPMAALDAALVMVSVTTLDEKLGADLEPRTSRPSARLKAVETLARAGVRVGVNVAPVIPGLTDHEMPGILKAASEAGAVFAGYTPVRLPLAVSPLFSEWLEVHRPDRKEKVLSLVRQMRGGKLNEAEFGSRMRGEGPIAEHLKQMFHLYARKYGLNEKDFDLSAESFCRPGDQLSFF